MSDGSREHRGMTRPTGNWLQRPPNQNSEAEGSEGGGSRAENGHGNGSGATVEVDGGLIMPTGGEIEERAERQGNRDADAAK